MAWRKPPKDATDQELAEDFHIYRTRPGGRGAPSVTKVISPLTEGDVLAQAKAKLTATIAVHEEAERAERTAAHRQTLANRYEEWPAWKLHKFPVVNLRDDMAVYFDWLRGEAERRWKLRADLGSRVHDHVYELAIGNDVDVADDELPFVNAWERYVKEHAVEFIPEATERVVLHRSPEDVTALEYGGRDDFFGIHHQGPYAGPICSDWKTGHHHPTKVTLQLCAYTRGEGLAAYDEDGTLKDELDPMPEAKHALAVYLRDDGTYMAWPAPVTDDTWATFLDLRRLVNYRKSMEKHEKEAEAEWKKRVAKQKAA